MVIKTYEVENEFNHISNEIYRLLHPKEVDKLAKDANFIRRQKKLRAPDFLDMCCFSSHAGKMTLNDLTAHLAKTSGTHLTGEAMNQKFNESASDFMKAVYKRIFELNFLEERLPFLEDFRRVLILDSSSFSVPGSAVKNQLEYDLLTGNFTQMKVQKQTEADVTFGNDILHSYQPGDLCIRDLGYFSLKHFETLDAHGAYFLSRLKTYNKIYLRGSQEDWYLTTLEELSEGLKEGESKEVEAFIGTKYKLPVRLLIFHLTAEQLKNREDHLARKKKKKGATAITPQHQKTKHLNVLITNLPHQNISREGIYQLYSLRWQIEILFKTWKSLFEINKMRDIKKERFECALYGKLIAILIAQTLTFKIKTLLYRRKMKETSDYKSMAIMKEYFSSFYDCIRKSRRKLLGHIYSLYLTIEKNGTKSKRKGTKTAFQILAEL